MYGEKSVCVTSEEIRKEMEELLYERFDLSNEFALERVERCFFGVCGLINPRELTYLAYMLERKYGIRFSMKEYDDQRFYSISGLSEIVADIVADIVAEKRCD